MKISLKPDIRSIIVVIMFFTFTFYGDIRYIYTINIIPETISSYLFGSIKPETYMPYPRIDFLTSVDFLGRVLVYSIFWHIIAKIIFWIYDTRIKIKMSHRTRRVIIFFSFFYLSYFIGVFLHEWGHAIFPLIYGCPFWIYLNPSPLGFSEVTGGCEPNVYGFTIDLIAMSMGIIVQFIIGSISFYFLLFSKFIRKSFMKYSFSYMFSLSNLGAPTMYLLFGSLFRDGDVGYILSITNLNYLLFFIPAIPILSLLIFIFRNELSNLLKLIDPKISKDNIKKWKQVFLIVLFVLLFIVGYRYYTSPHKF